MDYVAAEHLDFPFNFLKLKHNTEQKYTTLGYLRYVSDVWTMWQKAIIMLIHAQHTTNSYVTKLQYGIDTQF